MKNIAHARESGSKSGGFFSAPSIIIEKRLINILNDYGVFRENRALHAVLVDMFAVKLFDPLLTMSVNDMVKENFRNKLIHNFLMSYPYQEKVVNEIVEAVIYAMIIDKDERSMHCWLNVLKEMETEKGDMGKIKDFDIFDIQRILARFEFLDVEGGVVGAWILPDEYKKYSITNPISFYGKWKCKNTIFILFLIFAYSANNRINLKACPYQLFMASHRFQETFYDWYFEFLKKNGSDKKCSFELRFSECKERNLTVLSECFPDKDLRKLACCDLTNLFCKLRLMNQEGKIVNISPGKVMPRWGKAKNFDGEWSDLFEFVRFLYFASILQKQHMLYTPTQNMNAIIKKAHEMAQKELSCVY